MRERYSDSETEKGIKTEIDRQIDREKEVKRVQTSRVLDGTGCCNDIVFPRHYFKMLQTLLKEL